MPFYPNNDDDRLLATATDGSSTNQSSVSANMAILQIPNGFNGTYSVDIYGRGIADADGTEAKFNHRLLVGVEKGAEGAAPTFLSGGVFREEPTFSYSAAALSDVLIEPVLGVGEIAVRVTGINGWKVYVDLTASLAGRTSDGDA